jgi:hypothetical protein
MCDYSMMHVRSRDARIGDKLVVKSFGATRGFADINELDCAVCVKPGTEIAFAGHVNIYGGLFLNGSQIRYSTAIFRQVEKDNPHVHHDVLEFPNGKQVKLTMLNEEQLATVLQLPAAPKNADEARDQERIAIAG